MTPQEQPDSQAWDDTKKLVVNLLGCMDDNRGLSEAEITQLIAYAERLATEARIDEVNRYINRSDSLSEEKYAFRRLATLTKEEQ